MTKAQQILDAKIKRAGESALAELAAAYKAFPRPHASAHESFAVLLEETDELRAEVWKKQSHRDPIQLRKEAVQVAAMALRFLVDICYRGEEVFTVKVGKNRKIPQPTHTSWQIPDKATIPGITTPVTAADKVGVRYDRARKKWVGFVEGPDLPKKLQKQYAKKRAGASRGRPGASRV